MDNVIEFLLTVGAFRGGWRVYGFWLLVLLALAAALRFAPRGIRVVATMFERITTNLGRRRTASILLVAALALLMGGARYWLGGVPLPRVADEFSYLLAGDTFASGRLANPTHPMWVYFESPHINHEPTYVSMYHPAQGLVLAAGQALFGHPWLGVLLSAAAMCGATCWMLQAWLPPRWALVGGFLAVEFSAFSYWSGSYWGGAVAATGGALVVGALARLRRRPRNGYAITMAAGLAILANSRPYEGGMLGLGVAGVLSVWFLGRNAWPARVVWMRIGLPMVLVLAAAASWMAYYFWRTTGDPTEPPYRVNLERYVYRRMFVWGSNRPEPVYHHASMRATYRALLRADWSWKDRIAGKVLPSVYLFFGKIMLIPLLMLPWVFRDRRFRPLLALLGAVLAALALSEWVHPHYAAPITCVLMALVVQGMRHLQAWRLRGQPAGRFLVPFLIFLAIGGMGLRGLKLWAATDYPPEWFEDRARIEKHLEAARGRDLVIVRYSPRHDPHAEWVYNRADIEGSAVIWARDMGPGRNGPLLDHFHNRRAWLLEVDKIPRALEPYPLEPREPAR